MSVGRYFGVGPETLEEWKAKLDTTVENSTRPPKIIEYLTQLGLEATANQGMTIDDLRQNWREGKVTIVPLQEYGLPSKQASFLYGHYVAVIGATLGYIFVFDPSIDNVLSGEGSDQAAGRSFITEETWLKVWHDKDADGNEYLKYGITVGKFGAMRKPVPLQTKRERPDLIPPSHAFTESLPDDVREAVKEFTEGLLDEPYWEDLPDTVRDRITKILDDGVADGKSTQEVADDIEQQLGGEAGAEVRAKLIARSEMTGALNSGHFVSAKKLADMGVVTGKEWLGIMDDDIREAHEEANGQVVKVDEKFVVGGEECDYPGDTALSADNRCNCRCVLLSVTIDDEQKPAEDEGGEQPAISSQEEE